MTREEYFEKVSGMFAETLNRIHSEAVNAKCEIQQGYRYYKSSDTLARLLFNLFDLHNAGMDKLKEIKKEFSDQQGKEKARLEDVVLTETDEREMRREERTVEKSVANMVVNSGHDF